VLAVIVVETMIGRLGLDFQGSMPLRVFQCCKHEEAEGRGRALSASFPFLRTVTSGSVCRCSLRLGDARAVGRAG